MRITTLAACPTCGCEFEAMRLHPRHFNFKCPNCGDPACKEKEVEE